MSAYKFTPHAVASRDAPQKLLVKEHALGSPSTAKRIVQLVLSNLHASTRNSRF